MPIISVIVPIYKVEAYLDRCVESILAQTFQDFELILVEDGSPDRCPQLCKEWEKKDSRVRVIHKEHGGPSDARNAGIDWAFANSDSQWLSFIDSDDWVHPRFLELLYRGAMTHQVELSACNVVRTGDSCIQTGAEERSAKQDAMAFYLDKGPWGTVVWNKLYAKRLFEKHRFPVGKLHEDEFLTYRLLYDAGTVAVNESVLYYYFQNADGIMKTFSLNRLDLLEAIREQCAFFEKRNAEVYRSKILYLLVAYYSTMLEVAKVPGTEAVLAKLEKEYVQAFKKYYPELKPEIREKPWLYAKAFPRRFKALCLLHQIKKRCGTLAFWRK